MRKRQIVLMAILTASFHSLAMDPEPLKDDSDNQLNPEPLEPRNPSFVSTSTLLNFSWGGDREGFFKAFNEMAVGTPRNFWAEGAGANAHFTGPDGQELRVARFRELPRMNPFNQSEIDAMFPLPPSERFVPIQLPPMNPALLASYEKDSVLLSKLKDDCGEAPKLLPIDMVRKFHDSIVRNDTPLKPSQREVPPTAISCYFPMSPARRFAHVMVAPTCGRGSLANLSKANLHITELASLSNTNTSEPFDFILIKAVGSKLVCRKLRVYHEPVYSESDNKFCYHLQPLQTTSQAVQESAEHNYKILSLFISLIQKTRDLNQQAQTNWIGIQISKVLAGGQPIETWPILLVSPFDIKHGDLSSLLIWQEAFAAATEEFSHYPSVEDLPHDSELTIGEKPYIVSWEEMGESQ